MSRRPLSSVENLGENLSRREKLELWKQLKKKGGKTRNATVGRTRSSTSSDIENRENKNSFPVSNNQTNLSKNVKRVKDPTTTASKRKKTKEESHKREREETRGDSPETNRTTKRARHLQQLASAANADEDYEIEFTSFSQGSNRLAESASIELFLIRQIYEREMGLVAGAETTEKEEKTKFEEKQQETVEIGVNTSTWDEITAPVKERMREAFEIKDECAALRFSNEIIVQKMEQKERSHYMELAKAKDAETKLTEHHKKEIAEWEKLLSSTISSLQQQMEVGLRDTITKLRKVQEENKELKSRLGTPSVPDSN